MAAANPNGYNTDPNERHQDTFENLPAFMQQINDIVQGLQIADPQKQAFANTATTIRDAARLSADQARRGAALARIDRETPLLTTIPDFARPNLRNVCPNIRDIKIKEFSGANKDPSMCRDWLNRIMNTARAENLTEEATIQLLQKLSTGNVAYQVAQAIQKNDSLSNIIRRIEVTYGGVLDPANARAELRKFTRESGENASEAAIRIQLLAQMACRFSQTPVEDAEKLSRETLISTLDSEVESRLEQKEGQRLAGGIEPFQIADLATQIDMIENRVEQLRKKDNERTSDSKRQIDGITNVVEAMAPGYEMTPPEVVAFLQQQIDRRQNPGGNRGAFRGGNQRGRGGYPWKPWRPQRFNPMGPPQEEAPLRAQMEPPTENVDFVYAVMAEIDQDELEEIEEEGILLINDGVMVPDGPDRNRRNFYQVRYKDLGVQPDECWKCGKKGHRAFGPQKRFCPYQNQPLTKACAKCGKGGHKPEICVNMGPEQGPKN